MLIAQITDLHVTGPDSLIQGIVDANSMLGAAVDHLNRMRPQPEVVIATGDLADRGLPEEYSLLGELLARLEMPVYVLPGNHDERAPLVDAFPDHAYLPRDGSPLCWVVDDQPVRLVGVDTTETDRHDGVLDRTRLAWLDDVLTARPDALTLIDWQDDLIVNHTASFLVPERIIEVPSVVDDWDVTREYLLSRSPMPKSGTMMG